MADALPPLQMDFDAEGEPVVMIGGRRISDPAAILKAAPGLSDPKLATAHAQLVNHLVQGDRFELITDPAGFEAAYMAAYNAEDPEEEPRHGVSRLHDYGIPDFGQLARPAYDGGVLTFFAENAYMKIPYKAVLGRDGKVNYSPVAMKA